MIFTYINLLFRKKHDDYIQKISAKLPKTYQLYFDRTKYSACYINENDCQPTKQMKTTFLRYFNKLSNLFEFGS